MLIVTGYGRKRFSIEVPCAQVIRSFPKKVQDQVKVALCKTLNVDPLSIGKGATLSKKGR